MANIDMSDYVDVPARIAMFKEKYPNGTLQQVDLQFIEFGGKSWVVYTCAAYRTPDDPRPGIGTAWEQVPGLTPYTRDSELMNAETSAWGRAIIAVLAADSSVRRIASYEEVRNRREADMVVDLKRKIAARHPGVEGPDLIALVTNHLGIAPEMWTPQDLERYLTETATDEARARVRRSMSGRTAAEVVDQGDAGPEGAETA